MSRKKLIRKMKITKLKRKKSLGLLGGKKLKKNTHFKKKYKGIKKKVIKKKIIWLNILNMVGLITNNNN